MRLSILLSAAVVPLLMAGCMSVMKAPEPTGSAARESQNADFANALSSFAKGKIEQHVYGAASWEATTRFLDAAEQQPENENVVRHAVFGLIFNGKHEQAIELLKKACRANPTNVEMQISLGSIYQLTGNLPNAIEVFEKALERRPTEAQSYMNLAGALLQNNQQQKALEYLRKGSSASSNSYQLSNMALREANMNLAQRNLEGAIPWFAFLAENSRVNRGRFLGTVAEIYHSIGRTNDAIRYLEMTAGEQLSEPDLAVKLALDLAQENPQKILNILRKLDERHPDSFLVRLVMGSVYGMMKQYDKAVAVFQKLEAVAGKERADIYLALADIYYRMESSSNALRYVEKAIADESAGPEAFVRSAILLVDRDGDKALAVLLDGRERFPDDLPILSTVAFLYGIRKEYDKAIAAFQDTLDAAEREGTGKLSGRFYLNYGSVCERSGDLARAEKVFQECLSIYPDNHQVLNYLAYMWAEKGKNLDEGFRLVKRALELDPENGAYLDTLGWIYYMQGKHDLALEYLTRALKIIKSDAVIFDHLGDLMKARNNNKEAASYWQKSLAADPGNEALRKKMLDNGIQPATASPLTGSKQK